MDHGQSAIVVKVSFPSRAGGLVSEGLALSGDSIRRLWCPLGSWLPRFVRFAGCLVPLSFLFGVSLFGFAGRSSHRFPVPIASLLLAAFVPVDCDLFSLGL